MVKHDLHVLKLLASTGGELRHTEDTGKIPGFIKKIWIKFRFRFPNSHGAQNHKQRQFPVEKVAF